MVNQVILVGRLTRDIEVNTSENGIKVATISIAVPRSFKNSDGVYDTDFIDCIAFGSVANNTHEYCSRGDTVGIKSIWYTIKNPLFISNFNRFFLLVIYYFIK